MLTPYNTRVGDMARVLLILACLSVAAVAQTLTPSSYLTAADLDRLRGVFGSVRPYGSDLQALHYSILGFSLLEDAIEEPAKACDVIKKNVDTSSVESLFYASSAAAQLKAAGKFTCEFPAGDAEKVLTAAIRDDNTAANLYYAIASLVNLGKKVDSVKASQALIAAIKEDDSPQSYGYTFLAASKLQGDLQKFYDMIEDVIAQADEIDDKYVQFEGGLYTTALVLDGAYKLATAVKKAPTLSQEKVIKFTNYFLSRKHVQQLKNAATVLSAIKVLTNNQFHIPIAVTLASQVAVSAASPVVQVRVSNLLGQSLGELTVTADTGRHIGDDAVVLSKKPFSKAASDSSLYELDFMKAKPARGFYKISISLAPKKEDKRLIGTAGAEVEVKVTTSVSIENVEIGIADKEQSSAAKTTKLAHPKKAANVLSADHHQKLIMKFQLRDEASRAVMTAHQTFLRLTNAATQQEIIFVAETDASDTYKFDLDVGGSAKDFGYLSGKYTLDLVVGDAVIQNPFSWTVADVQLTFQDRPFDKKEDVHRYSMKPEIKHMFREPEKRPPTMVSNVFSVMTIVPILIMFVLWAKIGVNISNFPMSISAIGFHVGLGGIFALYYFYWTHLTMFTTLRYLGILSVPTFLCGNRLLSSIAAKRK